MITQPKRGGRAPLPRYEERTKILREKISRSGMSIISIAIKMATCDVNLKAKLNGMRGWRDDEINLAEYTVNEMLQEKFHLFKHLFEM